MTDHQRTEELPEHANRDNTPHEDAHRDVVPFDGQDAVTVKKTASTARAEGDPRRC